MSQLFPWNIQNVMTIHYIIRKPEKAAAMKNCAKLLLFQCQILKQNTARLLHTFALTTFIIIRMWFWTQIPMSHVLLPTAFSGKGLFEATSHWIILRKMMAFIKWNLFISRSPRYVDYWDNIYSPKVDAVFSTSISVGVQHLCVLRRWSIS